MTDGSRLNSDQTEKDDTRTLMNAQLAIFIGELLSQTESHTPDGNFYFSTDAMDGLSHLCHETGQDLLEALKAKGPVKAK